MKRAIPLLSAILATTVLSCVGNGVGLDENGNPVSEDRGGPLQPTWRSIQDNILTPRCSWCHPKAGLNLDEANSYDMLVGIPSTEQDTLMRVRPGEPDRSYMIWKLEGDPRIRGVRMPADENYLEQVEIDVIRQWIAAGAPRGGGP